MAYVAYGFRTHAATGPYLYAEHGRSNLHLWFRYFRYPWHHGWRWGYTLTLRGRTLLFGGRR